MPETVTVAEASRRLGISVVAVDDRIGQGLLSVVAGAGPRTVLAEDVEQELLRMRREAFRGIDNPVKWAREIRALIWPAEPVSQRADEWRHFHSQPRGESAVRALSVAAQRAFGRHLLAWVATKPEDRPKVIRCGYCWADFNAQTHKDAPRCFGSPAEQALTGEKPCTECLERLDRYEKLQTRIAQIKRLGAQRIAKDRADLIQREAARKRKALREALAVKQKAADRLSRQGWDALYAVEQERNRLNRGTR